jgi:hypothetical protein
MSRPLASDPGDRYDVVLTNPSHGDTDFTVPLFDEFMRRIMPGTEW